MNDDESTDELERLLVEIETLRGKDPAQALEQLKASPKELTRRPEARLFMADLQWEIEGAEAARPPLEELVRDVPDYADARHLLGAVFEELGEEQKKIEQFLEVLRLDEGLDEGVEEEDEQDLEDLIVEAAEQTLSGLPEPFSKKLSEVPVLVEPRPSEDLVREGVDPRSLGLFEGPTQLEQVNGETTELPTRIVLYSTNLLAQVVDEDQLRAEVEITVLHELGHYFGLDEADLTRLGLD